ncbi:MAG: hypothetical protein PHE83_01885 [Opitutaceae bacterium]|nr:hypothetical protein [Opitutaceae bacterium]
MRTKVIRSGNSQAIRIPSAYRLKVREVEIKQDGARLVISDPRELAHRRRALRRLWGSAPDFPPPRP